MAKGKLVCIEGVDGTGKSTQHERLVRRLTEEGVAFRAISFPRYEHTSSSSLRAYLSGQYGGHVGDVNAYAASTLFAVDRLASYYDDWGDYYRQGGLIVSYRYTTSNATHQAVKQPESLRLPFCDWLFDFEYGKLGLPKPDLVFFLDMPSDDALALLRKRSGQPDIHERDTGYLRDCRDTGLRLAACYGWHVIDCTSAGDIRTVEDIHGELYGHVMKLVHGEE